MSKSDSLEAISKSKRRVSEKQWHQDSVKQDFALAKILEFANQHIGSSYSQKNLKIWPDTTLSSILSFGNLFSKERKHLIIQNRINRYEFNENVYLLKNSRLINVIKEKVSDLTFVTDSVADVNGDGYKDFLFNWYPESGCCARNVYNVYLYMPKSGAFSKKRQFVNPDFFPQEKVIRGVGYGHPGEVALYKYKWNGINIDTIEYIVPTDLSRKKFYIVSHYKDIKYPEKRKVTSIVPKEYRKIGGYKWFMWN